MRILRGECKTPGGKLVAVNVTVDGGGDIAGGTVTGCRLDGDFFVDGDDVAVRKLIGAIERALMDGESAGPVIERYERTAGVRLVGTDAAAIDTAYARAVGGDAAMGAEDFSTRLHLARNDNNGEALARNDSNKGMLARNDDGKAAFDRHDDGTDLLTPSVGLRPTAPPVRGRKANQPDYLSADNPASLIRGRKEVPGLDRSDRSSGVLSLSHAVHDSSLIRGSREHERRWAVLRPDIIHDVPREPAEQMIIDEQWAREVASGERPATIRFWEWASPAVVVGRYQSIPDEVHEDVAARDGFAVVRRCTGGGAMFIEPGNTITYSLYAPLSFVAGISIEESYRLCDHWLIESLRDIGVTATFSGINDIAATDPATGKPAGKIGGAAQRRFPAKPSTNGNATAGPGSVLHHVTLAYDIDAEHMGRVLNTSAEKLSDKAVRSARRRVDPLRSQTGLPRDEIVRRMIAYLRSTYRS